MSIPFAEQNSRSDNANARPRELKLQPVGQAFNPPLVFSLRIPEAL